MTVRYKRELDVLCLSLGVSTENEGAETIHWFTILKNKTLPQVPHSRTYFLFIYKVPNNRKHVVRILERNDAEEVGGRQRIPKGAHGVRQQIPDQYLTNLLILPSQLSEYLIAAYIFSVKSQHSYRHSRVCELRLEVHSQGSGIDRNFDVRFFRANFLHRPA